jgi:hypothetical protein
VDKTRSRTTTDWAEVRLTSQQGKRVLSTESARNMAALTRIICCVINKSKCEGIGES